MNHVWSQSILPFAFFRRRFVNYLLDSVAANLVQLRSITSPSHDVIDLISQFRVNQAALEALQEARP